MREGNSQYSILKRGLYHIKAWVGDMIKRDSPDPHIEITQILEERRNRSERLAGLKRSEVAAVCPGFSEIENRIRNAGLKYNRMILSGELPAGEAAAKMQNEIDALSKEKLGLLTGGGFDADYLDEKHICEVCGDTGFIGGDDGAPVRCSCYKQLLIERLYEGSNIASSAGGASFEAFNPLLYSDKPDKKKYGNDKMSPRENITGIRDSSISFVNAFISGIGENLYFFGPPGTGKTFVSLCIAKRILDEGFTVLYMSAPTLFNTITEYRMKAFRDEFYRDASYQSIIGADLLIVDDLGTESMTAARYSEFLTLLNSRAGASESGRSTILSTNMDPRALRNAYDERVFSRIMGDYKVISFFGDDLRLTQK